MDRWLGLIKKGLVIAVVAGAVAINGCEGTDTRSNVDDTVEELAGKKNLDRYHRMKDDIEDIQQQQEESYDQLDDHQDNN